MERGDSFFRSIKEAVLRKRVAQALHLILAQLGFARYRYRVALEYSRRNSLLYNEPAAIKWCLLAAGRGFTPAQVLMAQFYIRPVGVPRDDAEAFRWYQQAASGGDSEGIFGMAWCYERGCGVPENKVIAFKLWMDAAARGLPAAKLAIAECFFKGTGIRRDLGKAKIWCERAIESGAEPRAKETLKAIKAALDRPLPLD
jgi:uncharacterized protein